MRFLFLAFLALAVPHLAWAQTNRGVIAGQIRFPDGSPAPGILVFANGIPPSSGWTDDAGNYRFENLADGAHSIRAFWADFETYYPGTPGYPGADIVIESGAVATGIDFRLGPPYGPPDGGLRVRGRILPAAERRVSLEGGGITFYARGGGDGSFEFAGIRPGVYALGAGVARGIKVQRTITIDHDIDGIEWTLPGMTSVTGDISAQGGTLLLWPRLLLAGGSDSVDLTLHPEPDGSFTTMLPQGSYKVTVVGGIPKAYSNESLTLGDIDLLNAPLEATPQATGPLRVKFSSSQSSPPVRVRGRVLGGPQEWMAVVLPPDAVGELYTSQTVGKDGSFEFPKVIPGVYELRVQSARFGWTYGTIVVGARDVDDLELTLPAIAELSGRVLVEGGRPAPPVTLTFAASGMRESEWTIEPGARPLALPVGEYRVRSSRLPAAYALKGISYGGVDISDAPFRIGPSDSAELQVTLGVTPPTWFKVSGRIAGAKPQLYSKPAAIPESDLRLGATPLLFSNKNVVILQGEGLRLRSEIAASDRAFEFPQVPPGTYTVSTSVFDNHLGPIDSARVVVTDRNVEGIELTVPDEVAVAGQVSFVGGGQLPLFWCCGPGVSGMLLSFNSFGPRPNPFSLILRLPSGPAWIDAGLRPDGTFDVKLPAGEYPIAVYGLSGSFQVEQFTAGTQDLLRQPLKVGTVDKPELRILLRFSGPVFKVEGRVVGDLGGRENLRVSLEGNGAEFTTAAGPDGSFEFPQVAPGNYMARAGRTEVHVVVTDADIRAVELTLGR